MHTQQAIKCTYDDPDALLDQSRVAKYLNVTEKFLEARRVRGGGPPFCKIGRLCRYRLEDVNKWIIANRCASTSEPAR